MDRTFELETSRLILKPVTKADVDFVFKLWSNPEVMKYIPSGTTTFEWVEKIIGWMVEGFEKTTINDFTSVNFIVNEKASNLQIGWCGMMHFLPFPDDIELYVGFEKSSWGKGYAEETAKALLKLGFMTFGFKGIMAIANKDNNASIHILEKLGMSYKKTVTGSPHPFEYHDGELYYSMKRDDFVNQV